MTFVTHALAMMPAMDSAVRKILILTDHMLTHANDGDWDKLAQVELARRQVMRRYFGDEIPEERRTPVVADAIRIVLRADQEIARKVESGKSRLAEDFRHCADQQRASTAYRSSVG